MAAPALPCFLLLLGMLPAAEADARVGESVSEQPTHLFAHIGSVPSGGSAALCPRSYHSRLRSVFSPDTAKKLVVVPDTANSRPPAVALVPDEEEKLTRKSALYIVAAMAVLTLTTLLLYNVRSR